MNNNGYMKTLGEVVPAFYENKVLSDKYTKTAKDLNEKIKGLMEKLQLDEVEIEGYAVLVSSSDRTKINEDKLIKRLKDLGVSKGVIKRREYVDMDALENLIYSGELNALQIADCQEIKTVKTLRVKNI